MTLHRKMRKGYLLTLAFLLAVWLIPWLMPFHVGIVDAVTQQEVAGYGVRVPWWRVAAEPFLGLMLFFNRSLYALTEVPYALVWLFAGYLVWVAVRGVQLRSVRLRRRWFGGRIADIPLVAGLLLTLFVAMIFLRLPGNTIEKKGDDEVLVTTHCHTEWSHDGLISQKALWRWQRRNGFDAFFITDHNHHDKTLAFVRRQRAGEIPDEPLVMCGEEFSGTNHLSLLGLQYDFSTRGFSDSVAVDTTHAQGGAVIVNHWFDGEHMTLPYYRDLGVDGFEIENTATDRYYDRGIYRRILRFCRENGLVLVGGLDFHGYGNVCSLWNAFRIPGWYAMGQEEKERAILGILRSRDTTRIRVLMYRDRPYYSKAGLWYRPPLTLLGYFRTLNGWQRLSWTLWTLFLAGWWIRRIFVKEERRVQSTGRSIALAALIASLFLLGMALRFYLRAPAVRGYNDIYPEYARLFLFIGAPFFACALLATVLRLRRGRR